MGSRAVVNEGRRAAGRLLMTRAIVGLLAAVLCLGGAAADEVPAAGKGMEAVARLFVRAYRLDSARDTEIGLNDTASPSFSEARIQSGNDDFLLRRNAKVPCEFDLADTVVGKNETVSMGKRVASIWFNKLSGETETTFSPRCSLTGRCDPYYDLEVLGLPGAVCDRASGKEACFDRLTVSDLTPDQLREMLRVLRFVFANVCSPTELPF
jgi:hypothetical protein